MTDIQSNLAWKSLRNACDRFLQSQVCPEVVKPGSAMKHYTVEYKQAIVNVSQCLGVRGTAAITLCSAASISRWRKRIDRQSRSDQSSCITQIMVQSIKEYVHSSVSIRAHDVQKFILDHFKLTVSRQLVQIILSKRLNLSFKRTRKRGRTKEYDPEYESRVRHFINRFQSFRRSNRLLVSIDETGYDQRVRPTQAYAEKGQQAIAYNPPVRVSDRSHHSLLLAIGSNGERFHQIFQTSVTGDTYADFILALPYPEGSVIIMDNHSIHDVVNVQVAMLDKGYEALFTPPHSPDFNPIEQLFGTMKTQFYKNRYSEGFLGVQQEIMKLLTEYGTPDTIQNYFRSVCSLVDAEDADVDQFYCCPYFPNTSSDTRWNAYTSLASRQQRVARRRTN